MTSSNTAAGGLNLRCKDDSKFLHSIDSHQVVKNVCTSQEYFQWDIFLTFTCNIRKHFGTKPIREWLDDNEFTMHFPTWDAYCFHLKNKKYRQIYITLLWAYLYKC